MSNLMYIVWNPPAEAFRLLGLPIRFYSLFWVIGLVCAYILVKKFYQDQKLTPKQFEPLFLYCFFGILIGARLGHCIFYEPQYYFASFTNFLEMLLPLEFTGSGVKLTGYRGLASHGGTIGIFIGLWLYCREQKLSLLKVIDMVCVATPTTAAAIRLGNLMNSEIVGKATGSNSGFVFAQLGEDFPRYPAQLYEAIAYLIIFAVIYSIYKKHKEWVGSGFYFGFCITLIFLFRFFIEFCKEVQSPWENGLPLDMGQLLSIPFVIAGVWLVVHAFSIINRDKKK